MSVITPTNPLDKSMRRLVCAVTLLKVTAVPAEIPVAEVEAVETITVVVPTDTILPLEMPPTLMESPTDTLLSPAPGMSSTV